MKLGIIGAMEVEVALLRQQMTNTAETEHAGSAFCEGVLEGVNCVVVRCGVGKVNAAVCSQILISVYGVTHIVNTGVAGSLSAELDIGDLVVSRDAMYHDFDCRGVDYPMGVVPGMQEAAFPADEALAQVAFAAAETVNPGHTARGRVASGDQFVSEKGEKNRIIHLTGALCTEMEGAAIAHTAFRNHVPFVILRAISDKADESAQMDYPTFETIAAHRCAAVTAQMARQLRQA